MKKKLIILLLLLLLPTCVYARSDSIKVTLNKCIDGDTASFNYKDEIYKVRFLAVNTTELKKKEKFSKEALDYTCNKLKNAKIIKLKFDKGSDEKDKYGRYLAWIFVDDKLLQEELIEQGLAKVEYIYGKYEYTDMLKEKEEIAKKDKLGVWSIKQKETKKNASKKKTESKTKEYLDWLYIILIIIFLIFGISTTKLKKIKKEINKIK